MQLMVSLFTETNNLLPVRICIIYGNLWNTLIVNELVILPLNLGMWICNTTVWFFGFFCHLWFVSYDAKSVWRISWGEKSTEMFH